MTTARSMLPFGKFAGAWRNKKTAPTATFMPSVFMIRASISETSRTSPVAFRRNTPVVPPLPTETAVLIPLLLLGPPLSGADQMNDAVLAMKTFDREAEAIRSIDHTRKLDRPVGRVVGRALDLEGGRAGYQAEQLRLVLAANHLDGAGGPGRHDAIERLHRQVEGVLGQFGVQDFGKRLGGKVGVEQGNRFTLDRCQPADEKELPLLGAQRVPNDRVAGDQPAVPDVDVRVEPFGAHALGEAGEDCDLLVDLGLLDERPAAARPMEIPLFDEVEDGLADGSQADAELVGILPLAGELLSLVQLAALDPPQQVGAELRVDRDSRRPTDHCLFVPHQRPLHASAYRSPLRRMSIRL